MYCTCNVTMRYLLPAIAALEKTITVTYSELLFIDLGNQRAIHMRYVVICGVSGSNVFFHIIS